MRLKRHLLTAALALFCLSAANAQLLRTTVEQGEIEGVEHEGFADLICIFAMSYQSFACFLFATLR